MLTRLAAALGVTLLLVLSVRGQEPIDLFADVPELSNDFVRIGAWNMRHINVEGTADVFLPGANEDDPR